MGFGVVGTTDASFGESNGIDPVPFGKACPHSVRNRAVQGSRLTHQGLRASPLADVRDRSPAGRADLVPRAEAEPLEQGGGKVVGGAGVARRRRPAVVGGPVGDTTGESAAGQEQDHRTGPVVAPGRAVDLRGPAELPGSDDDRLIQSRNTVIPSSEAAMTHFVANRCHTPSATGVRCSGWFGRPARSGTALAAGVLKTFGPGSTSGRTQQTSRGPNWMSRPSSRRSCRVPVRSDRRTHG